MMDRFNFMLTEQCGAKSDFEGGEVLVLLDGNLVSN